MSARSILLALGCCWWGTWIRRCQPAYPVAMSCRAEGVGPVGFCGWLCRAGWYRCRWRWWRGSRGIILSCRGFVRRCSGTESGAGRNPETGWNLVSGRKCPHAPLSQPSDIQQLTKTACAFLDFETACFHGLLC